MAQSGSLCEITPDLGDWLTSQVLRWDTSILSVMLVDANGMLLGHRLRDDPIEDPVANAFPLAVPVLGGKVMVFLRLARQTLVASASAMVSEFFTIPAGCVTP